MKPIARLQVSRLSISLNKTMLPSFPHGCGRGLWRRRHNFVLKAVSDLSGCGNTWTAIGSKPLFELEPRRSKFPTGWVVLQTTMVRRSHNCSAKLMLDLGEGYANGMVIDVPSTRNGRVSEVLCLPPGITGMRWSPQQGTGEIKHGDVIFTEVGMVEVITRMVVRILPVLKRRPREQLEAAGLSFTRILSDLQGAYRAAGTFRAYAAAPPYRQWIERFDALSRNDRNLILQHIACFQSLPRFFIIVDVPLGTSRWLAETLLSFDRQLYREMTVVVVNRGGNHGEVLHAVHTLSSLRFKTHVILDEHCEGPLNRLIAIAEDGHYCAVLQAGDVLAEHALYWMACTILASADAGLVYSDEDRLNLKGEREDPTFKPDWSPELLRSTNYIGQLAIVRRDVLQHAGGLMLEGGNDNHDLLLRVTDFLSASRIRHIPAILCHRYADSIQNREPNPASVEAHLMRHDIRASVTPSCEGAYRIKYSLPKNEPLITLIIPTRDRLSLMQRCLDSVIRQSTYRCYEIIVVDNQSSDRQTLEYMNEIKRLSCVRVLSYDNAFNYAAINNHAVSQANGEVLCLLNNDTEVISPDWMEEMLGHLVQDRVGVVGAKLYYSDGRIQHAGDVLGVGGVANHLHSCLDRSSAGYARRAVVAQDISSVTGACLMTWRSLYHRLGGLDQFNLPVAFNDVDYCLRVREVGYRVVWTPYAELFHHESMSRGIADTSAKRARAKKEASYMRSRWRHVLRNDPFYNPNLSRERSDFSLSHAPVLYKPWLAHH